MIYYTDEFKRRRKRRIIVYRFGHSLWSADQLPTQAVKVHRCFDFYSQYQSSSQFKENPLRSKEFHNCAQLSSSRNLKIKRSIKAYQSDRRKQFLRQADTAAKEAKTNSLSRPCCNITPCRKTIIERNMEHLRKNKNS